MLSPATKRVRFSLQSPIVHEYRQQQEANCKCPERILKTKYAVRRHLRDNKALECTMQDIAIDCAMRGNRPFNQRKHDEEQWSLIYMLADCYLANEDTVGLERFCVPPCLQKGTTQTMDRDGTFYSPDSERHLLKARVIAQALELSLQLEEDTTRFSTILNRYAPLRRFFLVHVAAKRALHTSATPPRFRIRTAKQSSTVGCEANNTVHDMQFQRDNILV